jgi:tetratricopeptide (TPR) repeat protein
MSRIALFVFAAAFCMAMLIPQPARADKFDDASKLFKQGDLAGAMEKIEPLITANPRDARARFLKGLILTEQSKTQEAIKVFEALTDDYPELPEPYNNLAVLNASQGNYDKARKALEMAIRTHPSYAVAHENLGDVYAKMASDAYDKALQLDSSNSAAQTKLAMIKDLFSTSVGPGKASEQPGKTVVQTEDVVPVVKPAPIATAKNAAEVLPTNPGKSSNAETDAVLAAVHGWAQAWSHKDADAYLAYYAPQFQVPGGDTRAAWEAKRRERITKPKMIEITVESPKVSFEGSGKALVKFRQGYKSDTLSTSGGKTLTLVKQKDRWQIVLEVIN